MFAGENKLLQKKNDCTSEAFFVPSIFATLKGQPSTVVPVKTPVKAIRVMTTNGVRRRIINAEDPWPTLWIPAKLRPSNTATNWGYRKF